MSWARVDDAWWSHRKVIALDLEARGLWVSGLSYACHQKQSVIPTAALLLMRADESIANRLVDAGLWDRDDDGYRIHDWDDYQSVSAKRAESGRKGGERSGETRRSKADESNQSEIAKQTKQTVEANRSNETKQAQPNPTQPNRTQPKDAAPTARRRNPIWDALTEVCGWTGQLTKSQQGRVAAAVKELQDVGATPDEINQRARNYKIKYPGMDVTPTAIAANWSSIATAGGSSGDFAAGSGGVWR
jgi:hypothetical protein